MKVLFTGSSSFTGYWFIRELVTAGHTVMATFRGRPDGYEGVRAQRVAAAEAFVCASRFDCEFGGDAFLDTIERAGPFDLLCHHAAEVRNYKDPEFDVIGALTSNTFNLVPVLRILKRQGCCRFLLTGSVFETSDGVGSPPMQTLDPYGLSKTLTGALVEYYALREGFRLGKFTIPNPFGPLEEPRFTDYLVRTWYRGEAAKVATPRYVRDNIHVSLLAKAYLKFAESLPDGPGFVRLNPSGYVESQGAFAQRFADAMAVRLGLSCELVFAEQTDFSEPLIRINTDVLDYAALRWDETKSWDELAAYYQSLFASRSSQPHRV